MRFVYDPADRAEIIYGLRFPRPSDEATPPSTTESTQLEEFDSAVRIRRPEPNYEKNSAVWLAAATMSRTEASLRLAHYLLVNRLTSSDVHVALTGYELTRRWKPKFPVEHFLRDRECVREKSGGDWSGFYTKKDWDHALYLDSAPRAADVTATLFSGDRLVAHVSRGTLKPTRSSGEHKVLRGVIGRALTFEHYLPNDIIAAAVPRSERYRTLAARWRARPAIVRAGLLILTVDRTGRVHGLEPANNSRREHE